MVDVLSRLVKSMFLHGASICARFVDMTEADDPDPQWWQSVLVSLSEAASLLGEERSTLSSRRNLRADNPRLPRFPDPVETSSRTVLFRLSEVVDYSRAIGRPITPSLSAHLAGLARRIDPRADRRTIALAVAERAGYRTAAPGLPLPAALDALVARAVDEDGAATVVERLLSDDDRTSNRSSTFTPADAIDLLVGVAGRLMDQRSRWRALDPCAGEGGLLVAIGVRTDVTEVTGIEIDEVSARLAQARLAMAGVAGTVHHADALQGALGGRPFDLVVGDLPFGRDADTFAWIDLALGRLRPDGWSVLQVPDTVLASSSTARRAAAAESGRLRLIARLPASLRRSPKSRTPALVVLGPAPSRSAETLVVDLARIDLGTDEQGEHLLTGPLIAPIVAAAEGGSWPGPGRTPFPDVPAAVFGPDQLLRTEDVWSVVSGPSPRHYRTLRRELEEALRRIQGSTDERGSLSPAAAAEADQKTLDSLQRLHRRLGRFLADDTP